MKSLTAGRLFLGNDRKRAQWLYQMHRSLGRDQFMDRPYWEEVKIECAIPIAIK